MIPDEATEEQAQAAVVALALPLPGECYQRNRDGRNYKLMALDTTRWSVIYRYDVFQWSVNIDQWQEAMQNGDLKWLGSQVPPAPCAVLGRTDWTNKPL